MRSGADDTGPAARRDVLRRAFLKACRGELEALKPGNVHVYAAGHGMVVDDFLRSAAAAAVPLCRPGAKVGARIRAAVEASWEAVPLNTNLGIVLLAAPVLAAAEGNLDALDGADLRARIARVLDSLTVADAADAFAAIARANPAGLGRAPEQDVAAAPTVTLREAMRLAAGRDRIARQYASSYADIFETGVARLGASRDRGLPADWATTLVFLDFLSRFPDSHIARKFGDATAESVRREAEALQRSLPADEAEAFPILLAFDRDLKARGLNPGTSADLTVGSLLAFEVGPILTAPARDEG